MSSDCITHTFHICLRSLLTISPKRKQSPCMQRPCYMFMSNERNNVPALPFFYHPSFPRPWLWLIRKREVTVVFTVMHKLKLPKPMEQSKNSNVMGKKGSPQLPGFLLTLMETLQFLQILRGFISL